MATGYYPAARQVGGFNADTHYWRGNKGRAAVVLHICEGPYIGSINYLRSKGLSAHFVISEGGEVSQLVNVNDSAWANGLSFQGGQWISPEGHVSRPTWTRITPPINPNWQTISIEHAGYTAKPRPRVQLQSTINLLRWLGAQFPSLYPYVPQTSLIGHCHISSVDRANCPGQYFDLAAIAAAANTQAGRYRVRGLRVYQAPDKTSPLAGELPSGAQVGIDATYANGMAHLDTGFGFVELDGLEAL